MYIFFVKIVQLYNLEQCTITLTLVQKLKKKSTKKLSIGQCFMAKMGRGREPGARILRVTHFQLVSNVELFNLKILLKKSKKKS